MKEVIKIEAKGLDLKLLKPEIDGQLDNIDIYLDIITDHIKCVRNLFKRKRDSQKAFGLDLIEIDIISIRKITKGIKEIKVGD